MRYIIRANVCRVFQGLGIYVTLVLLLLFSTFIALGATPIAVANYGSETLQTIIIGFSNLIYVPLALAIFVSGALFTYGAIANELAFGLSRAKIYISHLLLGSVLCVLLVLVFISWSVILGSVLNGFGNMPQGFWLEKIGNLGVMLLHLLALSSLATFLVFTSKRTSITIGAFFAYLIVPRLLVEMSSLINPYFSRFRAFDLVYSIVLVAQMPYLEASQIYQAVAVAIGTIVITTCIGIILFEFRDV